MAQGATAHPLRLKIGDRKVSGGGDAGAVQRAFRIACARAGTDFGGLQIVLAGLRQHDFELDALLTQIEPGACLFLLSGTNGTLGLAAADTGLISAVIEFATTGIIGPRHDPEHVPTRTEIAIFSDFLGGLLPLVVAEVEELPNPPMIPRLRVERPLNNRREAELALENKSYCRFDLSLGLGDGARSGMIQLHIPMGPQGAGATARIRSGGWRELWQEQVEGAAVRLEAVIYRTKKPLKEIASLEPGSILKLPMKQLENVQIRGQNGMVVARGKLGRQGPYRAVRIEQEAGRSGPRAQDAESFDHARPASSASHTNVTRTDIRAGGSGDADNAPQMPSSPPGNGDHVVSD